MHSRSRGAPSPLRAEPVMKTGGAARLWLQHGGFAAVWLLAVLLCCPVPSSISFSRTALDLQRPAAERTLRLRGGVMWVGGGRQFNRSHDPTAGPETVEDTFTPLLDRLDRADRIKYLYKKHGPKYRTNEVCADSFLMGAPRIRAMLFSVEDEALPRTHAHRGSPLFSHQSWLCRNLTLPPHMDSTSSH